MYNSDVLIKSNGDFVYKKNTVEGFECSDLQFKTDKNTNIIALMNRYNQLKYMADLSILDMDLAINNLFLEAQNLGLDILKLDIKIENNTVIISEFLEGRE